MSAVSLCLSQLGSMSGEGDSHHVPLAYFHVNLKKRNKENNWKELIIKS